MKTFKEWFNTIVNDTQYLGMDLSKMAWEYQQKEIDKLNAKLNTCLKYKEEPYEECIRLQNANCKLGRELNHFKTILKEVDKLSAKFEKAKKALEYYADIWNWDTDESHPKESTVIIMDIRKNGKGGKRACEVLKELEGLK